MPTSKLHSTPCCGAGTKPRPEAAGPQYSRLHAPGAYSEHPLAGAYDQRLRAAMAEVPA
jgi:hypothetical protein